ncbi:peptidase family M64 protein [Ceratobasidium sp. AG-Ba]|nr:peptidase family M64 protein [Ceratobasidium sp. AG-Ba]QRW08882.1 peptidase family M64 protein [Ceratobasidium sp. AG-Ba]
MLMDRSCKLVSKETVNIHPGLELTSDAPLEVSPVPCAPEVNANSCFSEHISVVGKTFDDAWKTIKTECDYFTSIDDSEVPKDLFPANSDRKPQQILAPTPAPHLEVRPLSNLVTGRSSNRVDIVFFSDGYTVEEKSKFYDDATRLAVAITVNQTYAPVAPLLNFWGAFTPSAESGIGVGGKPKDTVYGLYRDGTELRGVYTSKPKVAEAACRSLGPQCNYPLLLGNDPLYGGLGGEFTISTASVLNGPLVLRHELGHSIIWIGDEYDGSAYFGVNADTPAYNESIKWDHWLSEPASADNTPPRIERNYVPLLAYPWTMLNTTKAWSTTFNSDGTFSYALLRFSLSAVPDAKTLDIRLDGKKVSWEAKPGVGVDRWFYDVWINDREGGLRNGTHELSFALQQGGREGLAQLCSVEVIEYGNEKEFNFTAGYVGAFPTYSPEVWGEPDPEPDRFAQLEPDSTSSTGSRIQRASTREWPTVSYRPTNEGCLMRQVAMPDFCVVCTEHLWVRLLGRINLIDDISISSTCAEGNDNARTSIDVSLVPLAHLRSPLGAAYIQRKGIEEVYHVRWLENGTEIEAWRNSTRVEIPCGMRATYEVEATFKSSEIRKDEKGYTVDRKRIVVP